MAWFCLVGGEKVRLNKNLFCVLATLAEGCCAKYRCSSLTDQPAGARLDFGGRVPALRQGLPSSFPRKIVTPAKAEAAGARIQ